MANTKEYPLTQIALDGLQMAFDEVYAQITPELIRALNALGSYMESVKTIAKSEGVEIGDEIATSDGIMFLRGSSSPTARISKQGLIDLGEVGQAAVGAWDLAHANDTKTLVLKLEDKDARDIEIKKVMEYIKMLEKCKELAQRFAQDHPDRSNKED